MKKVLVFGTFDVLHPGHVWFLKKARNHGTHVIAAVSRDAFVEEWKGLPPIHDQNRRIRHLQESGLVEEAVLSDAKIRTYDVIQRVQPDLICLGHDQRALEDDLRSWLQSNNMDHRINIITLPPWKRRRYSSTVRNASLRSSSVPSSRGASWSLFSALIIAMILFGYSWIAGKRISTSATPGVTTFWRFALTGLCFVPIVVFSKSNRSWPKASVPWLILCSLAMTSYNHFFFLGLQTGMAGKGGVIVTTINPLMAAVLSSMLGTHKMDRRTIIALAMGIIGGIFLLEPWAYGIRELISSGNLHFIAAALSWAILTLASKKTQEHLSLWQFNLGVYSLGMIINVPFLIAEQTLVPSGLGWGFWINLAVIAILVGALATSVYFLAAHRLGAVRAGASTFMVPASALLFSILLLDERPTRALIVGGVLAMSAVLVMNWPRRNPRRKILSDSAPRSGT